MVGLITEKDWDLIDESFPGMKAFYERMPGEKPRTFLELEWLFINQSCDGENLTTNKE